MFNIIKILPILLLTSNSFGQVDITKIEVEIDKVCANIKKERKFENRFKHVQYLVSFIDKEIKKLTQPEYDNEQEKVYKIYFYQGNLQELTDSFPKEDCGYRREKVIRNFSNYSTGEIPEKIKPLSTIPIKVVDAICDGIKIEKNITKEE